MNYSIIFTEIGFYPETSTCSILLQIIQFDRKGGQSDCSESKRYNAIIETPTENSPGARGGPLQPIPPLPKRKGVETNSSPPT